MESPIRRNHDASDTRIHLVPSQDRFARTDGRPQRTTPLTRKIEVASLLPDFSTSFDTYTIARHEIVDAACAVLAHGALLRTSNGLVAIEDLVPGDVIETSEGAQPVIWIGATQWRSTQDQVPLVRVMAGSFGPARPAQDCIFGAVARLRHCPSEIIEAWGNVGILSPVRDFTDGMQMIDITPPGTVQLFQIAFRRHATFEVGGLEIESFHPGQNARIALSSEVATELLGMFPLFNSFGGFGPLCLPRLSRNEAGDFDF